MELTPHQAKYFALELTRHTSSDDLHKLVPSLMDARVDAGAHLEQIVRKDIFFQIFLPEFFHPSRAESTLIASPFSSIHFKTIKKNNDESN